MAFERVQLEFGHLAHVDGWIVYPLIAIALAAAIDGWHTHRHKPITETEIRREIDRLTGVH